ncbi:MAG: TetR/AcrR family transcriptional regulator [Roseivirga sp.]
MIKQKIIESTIDLFNQKGFANVRLQHIADKCGISVGNLAYHFNKKEVVVDHVHELITEELQEVLSVYGSSPDLMELDLQLDEFHHFINKYPFYFIDILEVKRSFPKIHERRRQYINRIIIQMKKRLKYNMERGVVNAEAFPGQYEMVASTIWMIITFWVSQKEIKGENCNDLDLFKTTIWGQVMPLLTNKGRQEYQSLILK